MLNWKQLESKWMGEGTFWGVSRKQHWSWRDVVQQTNREAIIKRVNMCRKTGRIDKCHVLYYSRSWPPDQDQQEKPKLLSVRRCMDQGQRSKTTSLPHALWERTDTLIPKQRGQHVNIAQVTNCTNYYLYTVSFDKNFSNLPNGITLNVKQTVWVHCQFVTDHWHWLSSVSKLCYSAGHTKH